MKKIVATLFIAIAYSTGFTQNIMELFTHVPDTSVFGLSYDERSLIVKHSADNQTIEDAFDDINQRGVYYAMSIVDVKNGYLEMVGPFEGDMAMVYWNMTNGNKLVAIKIVTCGPVCVTEQFHFYEYDGLDFIPRSPRDIVPVQYNDFIKGDIAHQTAAMEKNDIVATLLFELPRQGKNIIARWGNERDAGDYKPYAKGNTMILQWNDGKFKMSVPEWK